MAKSTLKQIIENINSSIIHNVSTLLILGTFVEFRKSFLRIWIDYERFSIQRWTPMWNIWIIYLAIILKYCLKLECS